VRRTQYAGSSLALANCRTATKGVLRTSYLVLWGVIGLPDADEHERQRAGVTWALADLDRLLARGIIDARVYEALRRDYEARLRRLDSATQPVTGNIALPVIAEAHEQAPPGEATSTVAEALPVIVINVPEAASELGVTATLPPVQPPPAPSAAARSGGGSIAELWINLLLFLGAFFVVMASLIFVRYSGLVFGGGAKTGILAGFTAAFLVAGVVCLRFPAVRLAGHVFVGIGAILLPLDLVAAYTFILHDRALSGAVVWAWGSAICAIFYGALALRGAGRLYAIASTGAAISAWCGLLNTGTGSAGWLPVAFLVLPCLCLLAGRLLERTALGRATFGPVPAIAAQLLIPCALPLIAIVMANAAPRGGIVAAFGLAALIYCAATGTTPGRHFRVLHAIGAGVAGSLVLPAAGYAMRAPARDYAALVLAGAWAALAIAALGRRRGVDWSLVALIFAMIQAGTLLLPWGFFVRDGYPRYWTAIFAGVLLHTLLVGWRLRRPLLLYPIALAAALLVDQALRLRATTGYYGYAWIFTALALLPIAPLSSLRQRGVSRAWDAQLAIIVQVIGGAAGLLALNGGNRFQQALIAIVFVAANSVIVAIERREELLVLPAAWTIAAVPALVALSGAGPRWAPVCYAGVGLGAALGLQGWRRVPRERRPGWYMAHRWFAGSFAAFGPILAAIGLARPFADFLTTSELRHLVLTSAYGPAGLAMVFCGLALAADAAVTLRRPTGYGASGVLALAILMGIARITPNNPQAYAVPLGLYLLALSVYVAYERDLGPIRMPAANGLLVAAIAVILGTTFLQSLPHPWRYIVLGLGEGLVLLGATAFLRRRYGVALALAFLTLTTLRAVFDVARALPSWAVIGLLGLSLLGAGVLFLLRRDRIERWGSAALSRWSRLT
jgi:hypothetical protein